MKKIIISTNNRHKISEIESIIGNDDQISVVQPSSIDIILKEIEEIGNTYEENAILKLSAVPDLNDSSYYVLADDSGLEVEALNGRPGLYSARYAGKNASSNEKIEKILAELKDKVNRNAKFVSVVAIRCFRDEIFTFRGEIEGRIINNQRGTAGFGYDPIFIPNNYYKTFGELSSSIKDIISHRAIAVKKAIEFIKKHRTNG